jgi:hypothetical protein
VVVISATTKRARQKCRLSIRKGQVPAVGVVVCTLLSPTSNELNKHDSGRYRRPMSMVWAKPSANVRVLYKKSATIIK